MLIWIVGPYRSGANDRADHLAASLRSLEAAATATFAAGHVPKNAATPIGASADREHGWITRRLEGPTTRIGRRSLGAFELDTGRTSTGPTSRPPVAGI